MCSSFILVLTLAIEAAASNCYVVSGDIHKHLKCLKDWIRDICHIFVKNLSLYGFKGSTTIRTMNTQLQGLLELFSNGLSGLLMSFVPTFEV